MLGAKREALVKEFQFKYQDLQQREQQGTITPLDLQKESEGLQIMQDSIERYGQEVMMKLKEKEGELLQPIIDDINNAIKLVATENKYLYIFDYASGILLYADETKDVTKLVKAKLGMP
jgi:Skp family chaperone for outer membrane proteins